MNHKEKLPALTGLRFIAAFMVIITHVTFQTIKDHSSLTYKIIGRFDYAVAIFFILSGFLLWRTHFLNKKTAFTHANLISYYKTRIFRIFPAYLVVIIFTLGFLPLHHGTSLLTWLANLTLIQNYIPLTLTANLTQMWSLAVEMQFYLLLPLLAFLLRFIQQKTNKSAAVIIAVFIGWLLFWDPFINLFPLNPNQNTQIWVFGYLPWFLAGAWLAEMEVSLLNYREKFSGKIWLINCLSIGAFLIATTRITGSTSLGSISSWQYSAKIFLGLIFGISLVLTILVSNSASLPQKLLSHSSFQYLGTWSYGIFLWHLIILTLVLDLLNINVFQGKTILVLILTTAFTIPIAAFSFTYIEKPFAKFSRQTVRKNYSPKRA